MGLGVGLGLGIPLLLGAGYAGYDLVKKLRKEKVKTAQFAELHAELQAAFVESQILKEELVEKLREEKVKAAELQKAFFEMAKDRDESQLKHLMEPVVRAYYENQYDTELAEFEKHEKDSKLTDLEYAKKFNLMNNFSALSLYRAETEERMNKARNNYEEIKLMLERDTISKKYLDEVKEKYEETKEELARMESRIVQIQNKLQSTIKKQKKIQGYLPDLED